MSIPILQKFAAKQATSHEVLRELIAYDGWFAPLLWAAEACNTDRFDRICQCGDSTIPADRLVLFTSADELLAAQARYAEKGNLGLFAGPLPGVRLFEHLPRGLRSVEINPVLEGEHRFYIEGPAIDIARSMGKAVALERALFGDGDNTIDRLIDFDRYIALVAPNGAPATAIGAAGMKNPMMIFLADDAILPVAATSGGALAQHAKVLLSGEQLFSRFDTYGVDGILLLFDPKVIKAKPLTAEACRGLAEAIRGRAELARLEALAGEE